MLSKFNRERKENALQTESAVPSSRMPGAGGIRQAVLCEAPAASSRGYALGREARLWQQMAEGIQAVPSEPPAVCGVREAGAIYEGHSAWAVGHSAYWAVQTEMKLRKMCGIITEKRP